MDSERMALLRRSNGDWRKCVSQCKDATEAWIMMRALEKEVDGELAALDQDPDVNEQLLLDQIHQYNEAKDIAQSLVGSLANLQGLTLSALHKHYQLDLTS